MKNNMMKVVCVDDEKLALDFMTYLLEDIEHIQVIGSFQDGKESLDFILKEEVDVVFLDIQMPEIDGLQLAEKVLEKKPHIDIVFVTAYNEHAVAAFELNAIDYLMKPVKSDRLEKAIERLKKDYSTKSSIVEKANQLYIKMANNLSFALGDHPFAPVKWRTAKARELFLYLLQNKDTLVHKGTIMEMLWGDDLDRDYSILYTTVYNVRKALQPYVEHLELQNTNDGYMLCLHNVKVDLQDWEKEINKLPDTVTHDTIDDYIRVIGLNTGPYLGEYDYIWIESEKQRLENLYTAGLQKIVDYYINENKVDPAIEALQLMIKRKPELEDGHLMLMQLYADSNQSKLVTKQYDNYVAIQQSYELRPSPKIKKWFTDYIEKINHIKT